MKFSILIVNWNSKDYVRECLKSIRDTWNRGGLQIVVVDGGSFDGCDQMLAAEFPEVDFVQSPHNVGFGRSNNLGLGSVTGDRVLLLNPDTVLKPGALEELTGAFDKLPAAGLVGARLLNTDGSLQMSCVMPFPSPWGAATDCDQLRRRWWRTKGPVAGSAPVEVEAVSGACMLMETGLLRKLGGFDPRYFMYSEDLDLCRRVSDEGLKVYHVPCAEIIHHGGGSSKTRFSRFSVVMTREAQRVYMQTHHGAAGALSYRFLMASSALARIAAMSGAWLLGGRGRRETSRVALWKWWAILRWSIG
ncbi:MAG: glycosyltransferase family 2 protein, partial [Verrucomicrobiaceae bacterium]